MGNINATTEYHIYIRRRICYMFVHPFAHLQIELLYLIIYNRELKTSMESNKNNASEMLFLFPRIGASSLVIREIIISPNPLHP